jgi:hypothetical protein
MATGMTVMVTSMMVMATSMTVTGIVVMAHIPRFDL